jgi:hypothetical protein
VPARLCIHPFFFFFFFNTVDTTHSDNLVKTSDSSGSNQETAHVGLGGYCLLFPILHSQNNREKPAKVKTKIKKIEGKTRPDANAFLKPLSPFDFDPKKMDH